MYLRHLDIDGMKLLHGFSLDFMRNGHPRMWTVLVGRNGLCKTSILRAIALAASGRVLTNQLAANHASSLSDRRQGASTVVQVRAEFDLAEPPPAGQSRLLPALSSDTRRLFSQLTLSSGHRAFDARSSWGSATTLGQSEDPLDAARNQSLPYWFVAAYGVGRSLSSVDGRLDDRIRIRMESLFDSGSLVATDFAKRFGTVFGDHVANLYVAALREVVLRHADLLPGIHAFDIRSPGPRTHSTSGAGSHSHSTSGGGSSPIPSLDEGPECGVKVGAQSLQLPPTWLSHGYQSTLAWVADLVGHLFWDAWSAEASTELSPSEMSGLVLVDELDLHLHPSWQVGLIPALKQTFPKLQFVVTTHSPMLLAGLEADEIVMLDQDPHSGDVVGRTPDHPPRLMTGTELLQRYFGIDRLHPTNVSKQAYRYARLASDPQRSDEEDEELRRLRAELDAAGVAPDWEPVERRAS